MTDIEIADSIKPIKITKIAKKLGLNEELTRAIATSHDLGHAPFGHHGESLIASISKEYLKDSICYND